MQVWYERTAERALPQSEDLASFLEGHHTNLPQIGEDQRDALEKEFSVKKVKQAIREAHKVGASGPSGYTIAFFKLLFLLIPCTMMRALNQLIFLPLLLEDEVQHKKVIYSWRIPNRPVLKMPPWLEYLS
jgi:hypothetical protein